MEVFIDENFETFSPGVILEKLKESFPGPYPTLKTIKNKVEYRKKTQKNQKNEDNPLEG